MHMPVPVDDEMLERLKRPDEQIDGQVVKYLLTYFTSVALQLPVPKRCAVVEPHFTHEVMREREARKCPRKQAITTPRPFYGQILTGCRDGFDYLLIPLYHDRHHMLATWTRSTRQLLYYNPTQPRSERYIPGNLFLSTLEEVFNEISMRGCEVRLKITIPIKHKMGIITPYKQETKQRLIPLVLIPCWASENVNMHHS